MAHRAKLKFGVFGIGSGLELDWIPSNRNLAGRRSDREGRTDVGWAAVGWTAPGPNPVGADPIRTRKTNYPVMEKLVNPILTTYVQYIHGALIL